MWTNPNENWLTSYDIIPFNQKKKKENWLAKWLNPLGSCHVEEL